MNQPTTLVPMTSLYQRLLFLAILALPAAADAYTLTVLHTNDFHARFEPISGSHSICSVSDNEQGKCFGGWARVATAIKTARERHANSILLDAGDQFQGSLFYTHYKGEATAEIMNRMGFEAMVVGNHEFDDGPEVLAGFIQQVNFPLLMSNADISREPALASAITKHTVIEKGGEKIGIIGVTPEDTSELASPGDRIVFTDPIKAVQDAVDELENHGINKIIVLSHSGFDVDLDLAANTKGVDIIVGGHSNTLLANSGEASGPYPTWVGKTAIVQAYAYGKYLGELTATFDRDGVLTGATGEPLLIDASIQEDAEIKDWITRLAEPLAAIRNKVIGSAEKEIDGNAVNCRTGECEMGVLLTDAMLDRVRHQGVTIALTNGGGIRASIDRGDVTLGEVMTVLPFQNTLSVFETDGKTLWAALENGVSQVEQGKGRFPQVAGMRFTWNPNKQANSGRIEQVEIQTTQGWIPIDLAATYRVVSNNYLRNGGDGYHMLSGDDKNAYDFGPDLADVVAEYLSRNPDYQPRLEGRIKLR